MTDTRRKWIIFFSVLLGLVLIGEFAFRMTQEFKGFHGLHCDGKGISIGIADIFRGKAYHAAGNIKRILTGGQHASQVVERQAVPGVETRDRDCQDQRLPERQRPAHGEQRHQQPGDLEPGHDESGQAPS